MTRKVRLQAWAAQLNAPVPADPTVAQLEQAIEAAISSPATTGFTFSEGLSNNLRVLKEELPGTAKAVLGQFL